MYKKNEHCSYCGGFFLDGNFPKTCLICNNITYINPLPVSVTLVPCFQSKKHLLRAGILLVKRAIQPEQGKWALPGGYLEQGETWQDGAVREVREEIGLELDPRFILTLDVKSASNGNLLIFNRYENVSTYFDEINFSPNREVSDIKITYGDEELAFPTHQIVLEEYLKKF